MPTLQTFGDDAQLYEQPDSPVWQFGERVTATQTFRGTYDLCLASAPARGALGTGDFTGGVVAAATVARERGGLGVLTIVYEGTTLGAWPGGATVPADECEIEDNQQEFAIQKAPIFSELSFDDLKAIQAFVDGDDVTADVLEWIFDDELAQALVTKLQRGQTHFVLFPPVYSWTTHWLSEPAWDSGGYVEDPYGPVTPAMDVIWLRMGDKLSFNGSYWRLTRRWLGAYEWDEDIYP